MKLSKQTISILLGLILIILAFILSTSLLEFIGAFFFGIGIALSKDKKTRKRWIIYVVLIVILAIILDPILKNILDSGLNVNTVGNYKSSLVINGITFFSFVLGYSLMRLIIIDQKADKNINFQEFKK